MKRLEELVRGKPPRVEQEQRTNRTPTPPNPQSHHDTGCGPRESDPISSFPVGVKVLHDCPEATTDICFVHGLTGDRDSTWTARGHSTPWPKTLLPPKLKKARILTYGYDAYIVRKGVAGSSRLIDHATNLLHDLTTDRASCNASSRPLIFIAHSLGGIVCKEAILLSRNNPEPHLRSVFDCITGILFFGTPHRGSWMANWATIPASALGFMKSTSISLLAVLETSSQLLESVQVRFLSMIRELREDGRRLEVTCFFEELPLRLAGIVVSKQSATFEGYNAITIHANHRDMVRFASEEENGFKRVLGELARWESQAGHSWAGQPEAMSRRSISAECTQEDPSTTYYSSSHQNVNSISTGSSPAYVAQHQTIYQPIAQDPPEARPTPLQDCLKSLAFPKMQDRFHDIDPAITGTCEWLLQHESFRSWSTCDRGLLWIKGKPGSGKSTLLRYALDNLEIGHGDLVLSFFFHARGDELQRTPLGFFRSLVHQLLSLVPSSLPDLVDVFKQRRKEIGEPGEKWQWHLNELRQFVKSSLLNILDIRSVWLFVDAMDECGEENGEELLQWLKALLRTLAPTRSQSRICITCRHYPILGLDCEFEICPERENDQDISTYVQGQLSGYYELAASRIPALIMGRASGVFMWARLAVKQVRLLARQGENIKMIEEAIDFIPPELDELYQGLIRNTRPGSLKLIEWICFAARPLSLDELRWAMAVEPNCPYLSLQECQGGKHYVSDNTKMTKQVETLSCGLAEVVPSFIDSSSHTLVVQFIHQSVKDFFVGKGLLHLNTSSSESTEQAIGMAHYRLSRTCIRYLKMVEIGRPRSYNHSQFLFLHYATTSWMVHAKQCDSRDVPQDDLLELFSWPSNNVVQLWQRLYSAGRAFPNTLPTGISLVHVISLYGILRPLKAILQGPDQATTGVDEGDDAGRTPLSWAASNGQEAVVNFLLDKGKVNINSGDNFGRKPLSWAAENGHEAVVKLLLKAEDINVDWKDVGFDRRPLGPAAKNGHEGIVRLLLGTGKVDIDSKDLYGQTPLSWAAENGHEAIVKPLLGTGNIDINSKVVGSGQTPLALAAKHGHDAFVELLLDIGGVNIDSKDRYCRTPLWLAVSNGHEAIVELLLDKGKADSNTKDYNSQAPLLQAASNGHEAIVKLLLDKGRADINPRDNFGQTPLLQAASNGHEDIVKLLLDKGRADINSRDIHGYTPVLQAALNGHEAIVKLLLDTGDVELYAGDRDNSKLLSMAAWGEYDVVGRLLLDKSLNPDSVDEQGRTLLSLAAQKGQEASVRLLLMKGAAVDLEDRQLRTPLSWAAHKGQEASVRLLLAEGANVDSADQRGRTPLWYAVWGENWTVVRMLADKGANIGWADEDGRPLRWYANIRGGREAELNFQLATDKVDV